MNGDGIAADLIYIQKRKDIKFIDGASEDAFFNFVEQDSYLKANKVNMLKLMLPLVLGLIVLT
jgi:hypothetical protein